jgi:hypothetical protein
MSGFKVFALLGLSIEHHKGPLCPLLSPNYRKLLLNVRRDVVRHFLECSHPDDGPKTLDILSYAGGLYRDKSDSDYPSWLPAWNVGSLKYNLQQYHRASGTTPVTLRAPITMTELVLRGIKVDTVTEVGDSVLNPSEASESFLMVNEQNEVKNQS